MTTKLKTTREVYLVYYDNSEPHHIPQTPQLKAVFDKKEDAMSFAARDGRYSIKVAELNESIGIPTVKS